MRKAQSLLPGSIPPHTGHTVILMNERMSWAIRMNERIVYSGKISRRVKDEVPQTPELPGPYLNKLVLGGLASHLNALDEGSKGAALQ